jgi:uncharacterized protein with HEPN domain
MRNEAQCLFDILDAVNAIRSFLEGKSRDDFLESDLPRSAVLAKLIIVGEASANVSRATKDKYPRVPWAQISGFRNTVIHAYHHTSWAVVWNAAVLNAPELAADVERILASEHPDARPENF